MPRFAYKARDAAGKPSSRRSTPREGRTRSGLLAARGLSVASVAEPAAAAAPAVPGRCQLAAKRPEPEAPAAGVLGSPETAPRRSDRLPVP